MVSRVEMHGLAIRHFDGIIYGGTSAAIIAAVLSIENKVSPQKLSYQKLQNALLNDKQRLRLQDGYELAAITPACCRFLPPLPRLTMVYLPN